MKICYLRLNQYVELDMYNSDMLGTDIRLGLWASMIEQGHELHVLSPLKPAHKWLLEDTEQAKAYPFKWILSKITFDEVTREMAGFDAVFVEYASGKTMFWYPAPFPDLGYGKRIPYVSRTFDLISRFRGPCFYFQNDTLFMELRRAFDPSMRIPNEHIAHWTNILGKFDITSDKDWTILHTGFDQQQVKSDEYLHYDHPSIRMEFFPLGKTQSVHKFIGPAENPESDLVYIGKTFDPYRFKRLQNFYDLPDMKIRIHAAEMPKEPGMFRNVQFQPPIPQREVIPALSKGLVCVQLVKRPFARQGMMSQRGIEVVQSGALLLVDKELKGAETYVQRDRIVEAAGGVRAKVEELQALSFEQRVKVARRQYDRWPDWPAWSHSLRDRRTTVEVKNV